MEGRRISKIQLSEWDLVLDEVANGRIPSIKTVTSCSVLFNKGGPYYLPTLNLQQKVSYYFIQFNENYTETKSFGHIQYMILRKNFKNSFFISFFAFHMLSPLLSSS